MQNGLSFIDSHFCANGFVVHGTRLNWIELNCVDGYYSGAREWVRNFNRNSSSYIFRWHFSLFSLSFIRSVFLACSHFPIKHVRIVWIIRHNKQQSRKRNALSMLKCTKSNNSNSWNYFHFSRKKCIVLSWFRFFFHFQMEFLLCAHSVRLIFDWFLFTFVSRHFSCKEFVNFRKKSIYF